VSPPRCLAVSRAAWWQVSSLIEAVAGWKQGRGCSAYRQATDDEGETQNRVREKLRCRKKRERILDSFSGPSFISHVTFPFPVDFLKSPFQKAVLKLISLSRMEACKAFMRAF
jgi:hypothetical protein